jgi:PAS domain S-box-containing protein
MPADTPAPASSEDQTEALHRVSERYRVVVEQSPDAIWLAEDGRLQLVNPACVAMLGASGPDVLIGRPLADFAVEGPWPDPAAGEPPLRLERTLRRLDGIERTVELSIAAVPDHGGRAVQGVMRDVTERRLATEALERQREELQRLSASLTRAREEERRHVARELHDELGQRLSAIKLDLARKGTVESHGTEFEECRRNVIAAVDEAMAATRRIAADLRPPMLDDLGLEAALDWLVREWAARTGVAADLRCEPIDERLSGTAATAVYRIVQEALTNVLRHARARRVEISLACESAELVVTVQDDGVGLPPGAEHKRGSSGLMNIRERARDLGGVASVRNRPGGGCRLQVRLPLDRIDSVPPDLEGNP